MNCQSLSFSGAYVSDIQYKQRNREKREITGLVIKDSKGVTLYSKFAPTGDKPTQTDRNLQKLQTKCLMQMYKQLKVKQLTRLN